MTADNLTALPVPAGFVARKDESHGMRSVVRGVDPAARYEYDNDGWQTESLYTEQQVRALLAARDAERGRDAGFVLVNIGCIECGVSSAIVGVFDSTTEAEAHAERLHESHGWREGGQNEFAVFPLPAARNVCAIEYAALQADTARAEGE